MLTLAELLAQQPCAQTHLCTGLVGCFILCLLVSSLEAFTMYVLAKFCERYDANSYGNLVRRALGKKTSAALSVVLLLYLWGSCVAYLVRIFDSCSAFFMPAVVLGVVQPYLEPEYACVLAAHDYTLMLVFLDCA